MKLSYNTFQTRQVHIILLKSRYLYFLGDDYVGKRSVTKSAPSTTET